MDRMPLSVVIRIDPEAAERPHEDQIQLAVGEQGACAHAVSHPVSEHWCVGLLEPSFWSEFFGVPPNLRIYGFC